MGQDLIEVIRPLNDVVEEEVELEPPEEEQFGARKPRAVLDPKLPSQREIDEHSLTHLPYRNWCSHCVFGKGRAAPHFKRASREDSLPEVHFDYCFMSTAGQPLITILVAKERETKMCMATMVPMKRGGHRIPRQKGTGFPERDWSRKRGCGV